MMATVIGVVSGVLGIFQFFQGLFPDNDPTVSVVRVAAALNGAEGDGGPLSDADGDLSDVRLYNEHQEFIGAGGSGYVESGGFHDFTIGQDTTQQAAYVQLRAGGDALCIPYISTTWVDGQQRGWTGDWGQKCGLDWYVSDVYVDEETNYQPHCTWVDGDHTNGIKTGALFIHMPSFADTDNAENDPNSFCGFQPFRAYSNNDASGVIFKRGLTSGTRLPKRKVDNRLVISNHPGHNATELCSSITSRGPDFVSVAEGMYCNMETRELVPICSDHIDDDCFHVENKAVKSNAKSFAAAKEFRKVIEWTK